MKIILLLCHLHAPCSSDIIPAGKLDVSFLLITLCVMAIKGKRHGDFMPGPLTYESIILGSRESFLDCSLTRKSGTLLR